MLVIRVPGKGVCGGTKFLAPPYYSQRAVFASLSSAFSLPMFYLFIYFSRLSSTGVIQSNFLEILPHDEEPE